MSKTLVETGKLVLVSGADGTGKSTLIRALSGEAGHNFVGVEPSATPETVDFKHRYLTTQVDPDFIRTRHGFYLGLQRSADADIAKNLNNGVHIATSGNSLVTHLSHAVMRATIGETVDLAQEINRWHASGDLIPDVVVTLHAPMATLRERITDRLAGGDVTERFWGFNSPFFLERYQDGWLAAGRLLAKECGISVMTCDTSYVPTDSIVQVVLTEVSK